MLNFVGFGGLCGGGTKDFFGGRILRGRFACGEVDKCVVCSVYRIFLLTVLMTWALNCSLPFFHPSIHCLLACSLLTHWNNSLMLHRLVAPQMRRVATTGTANELNLSGIDC